MADEITKDDPLIPPGLSPVEIHLVTIAQSLVRLEGKIDKTIDESQKASKVVEDHEIRIRSLEQSKWKAMGIVVGISSVVSGAIVFLKNAGVIPV